MMLAILVSMPLKYNPTKPIHIPSKVPSDCFNDRIDVNSNQISKEIVILQSGRRNNSQTRQVFRHTVRKKV